MDANPYRSPQSPPIIDRRRSLLRPNAWVAGAFSLVCLYAPVAWISFSSRMPYWYSITKWVVFLLTSPGEWYAQRCGARMFDYFFFAGLATVCLFALGIYFGRRRWLALFLVNIILTASS